MKLETIMLVSDSLMGGMSVYLTYTVFKLLKVLKTKVKIYKFGSNSWWHWLEHIAITVLCFIGLLGLSITKIIHTVEQSSDSVNYFVTEFNEWMFVNGFTTMIMVAIILLVNHTANEEKTFNYAPPQDLVDGVDRRTKSCSVRSLERRNSIK